MATSGFPARASALPCGPKKASAANRDLFIPLAPVPCGRSGTLFSFQLEAQPYPLCDDLQEILPNRVSLSDAGLLVDPDYSSAQVYPIDP